MTLHETLLTNPALEFRDNIFYQRNLEVDHSFEESYLSLRKKEDRLYTDDVVGLLPKFQGNSSLSKEWKIRNHSANRLIKHLKNKHHNRLLLEVGCGNGWLCNLISTSILAQVVGLDLNRTELIQGSTVFQENKNIAFLYGDIFSIEFRSNQFDTIILASVIQYFPDPHKCILRLLQLLKSGGEIHILDSPFYYSENEQERAKNRTQKYFEKIGQNATALLYHHHLWSSLDFLKPELLHNPNTASSRLSRKFSSGSSPFPHIIIHK